MGGTATLAGWVAEGGFGEGGVGADGDAVAAGLAEPPAWREVHGGAGEGAGGFDGDVELVDEAGFHGVLGDAEGLGEVVVDADGHDVGGGFEPGPVEVGAGGEFEVGGRFRRRC